MVVKKPPAHARGKRDVALIPGSGRSPGGGHVNERVTGRKARDLPVEEIGCKCQTFFTSLLSSKREQTSVTFFPLLYTNFKKGFS